MKLRAKVRHLRRSPGDINPRVIQTDREELTSLVHQLKEAQQLAGVAEPNTSITTNPVSSDPWDDLAFDPILSADSTSFTAPIKHRHGSNSVGPSPIEDQTIALPSNGNTSNIYRDLELTKRISMADNELNQIRTLIAEKSFQFSHVIRASPRKGVTTRSRAAVKKLNNEIAEHCRMYARCRSCLQILQADNHILSRLKLLNPEDVGASTAMLNPNAPGSTRINLSWIWRSSARHILEYPDTSNPFVDVMDVGAEGFESLLECTYSFLCFFTSKSFFSIFYILVRRVHWLRARAQLMRWKEEVTLTTYEMQWTVKYFAFNSEKWSNIRDSSAKLPRLGADNYNQVAEDFSFGSGEKKGYLVPGVLAYAKRKVATWRSHSIKSDRIFTLINDAYKSPL